MKDLESEWVQLPKEVRADYGHNYLEHCQRVLPYFLGGFFVSKKIYQVVDDMQDAVVAKSPKGAYRPGLGSKLIHTLVYLGPIYQLAVRIFLLFLNRKSDEPKTKVTGDVTADKARISSND